MALHRLGSTDSGATRTLPSRTMQSEFSLCVPERIRIMLKNWLRAGEVPKNEAYLPYAADGRFSTAC